MDYKDYQNKKEELHFWFRARKNLIEKLLDSALKGNNNEILDIGCGTGDELKILKKFGTVTALDINNSAVKIAEQTGFQVIVGDIQNIKLEKKYNCICCFDLLEHLKYDEKALQNIYNALKPNGLFIFTVPAYQCLFSSHDIHLEHFRRYNKRKIIKKLKSNNFIIKRIAFWNSLLFPLMALFRLTKKMLYKLSLIKNIEEESKAPNKYLNNILFKILNFEKYFINSKLFPPFGLSLYGIVKKEEHQ